METQQGEIENKIEPPRMEFTIYGNNVNLEEALSSDRNKRYSTLTVQEEKPGDRDAQRLLYILQDNAHITIEQYRVAMPRLFEHAAKKEGGFDRAYIGLFLKSCDITAAKMGEELGNPMLKNTWRYNLAEELRIPFYSRAYGYTEALRDRFFTPSDPHADMRTRAETRQRLEHMGSNNQWLDPSSSRPLGQLLGKTQKPGTS